jgi:hypothetical protein
MWYNILMNHINSSKSSPWKGHRVERELDIVNKGMPLWVKKLWLASQPPQQIIEKSPGGVPIVRPEDWETEPDDTTELWGFGVNW